MTATHVGIIHKVVVEQCVVMICLETNGRHKDVLGLLTPQIIAEQHKYRAYALAAQREYIFYWFVE